MFHSKQTGFIWLRCSCQASRTSLHIYQKVTMKRHWTMKMPGNMTWFALQNSLISGKTCRQRGEQVRISVLAARWSSQRAGEAESVQIKGRPVQRHRTFLLGALACPTPSKELLSWCWWQGRFHLTFKLTCVLADRHCEWGTFPFALRLRL